jgi:pimeloyl-ACP methyl ester carboxylesterase
VTDVSSRGLVLAAVCALVVVAGGTGLAHWAMTAGGEVTIETATVETDSGVDLGATVYEPPGASADDPAPAVVLIHGYTGERGTMTSFATELADRGYVAVAVDQPGHGESEPPAFADGWGGPAALSFTRSLATVNESRVALVGHSMGGFASLAAAADQPDGYQSLVLVGSTWGDVERVDPIPAANETFPRNMAVVFSRHDEFGPLMYDTAIPGNVDESEKLRAAFGTDRPVERGRVYGSVENGTARRLTSPQAIHTGLHRSPAAVADTVEWVTTTTGDPADGDDQHWHWATVGHILTFLGALVLAISVTALAWRGLQARGARTDGGSVETASETNHRLADWVVLSALPALAFYPLYALGTVAVPVTRVTHQELTHGFVVWALGTLALAAGYVRWRDGDWPVPTVSRQKTRHALAAAVAGLGVLYALVWLVSLVPGSGVRAWLVGLGVLPPVRWLSAIVYGIPLTAATVALSVALAGRARSLTSRVGRALALACGGLVVFVLVQYIPFFLGYGMPIPVLGPLASTALRTTLGLAVVTVVATVTTEVTDSPLPGGIAAGLLATWLLVATSPLHVAPF